MAHRSIEETFQAIKPKGRRGIPEPPVLEAGFDGTANLTAALSQAGQQIALLQAAYQQQSAAFASQIQAVQGSTSRVGESTGTTVGHAVSSLESGLGLLGPLISGIVGLFGGGSAKPAPLPVYVPPPSISIDGELRANVPAGTVAGSSNPASAANSAPAVAAPVITVNVTAMDSQSFMDRSADIASAVREAMLNLHPINDVVASL